MTPGPGKGALSGRTALITGAASGIGRGVAMRFAAEGARMVCADIDAAAARELADALAATGHDALAVPVDVTAEASVAAMVERCIDWAGGLDVAIANAGIMVEGGILSLTLDDWRRAMEVNATGAFLTARAVLPHLVAADSASLVFTASTVGLVGRQGIAAYSASKGAVIALTRQLAADFAASGVRVNAVAPGAVRTPLSESQFRARARDDAHFEALMEQVAARYPIARWGQVREIADAVLFLASDQSSWITGEVLPVDGGLLATR